MFRKSCIPNSSNKGLSSPIRLISSEGFGFLNTFNMSKSLRKSLNESHAYAFPNASLLLFARAALRAFSFVQNFCTRASICSRSRSSSCVGVFMFFTPVSLRRRRPNERCENESTRKENPQSSALSTHIYHRLLFEKSDILQKRKRKVTRAFCASRCVR